MEKQRYHPLLLFSPPHDKHRPGRFLDHPRGDRTHQPVQELGLPMGAVHDHPGAFRVGNTGYLPGWISGNKKSPDQELLLFERSPDRFQFLPGVIQYPAGNLPPVLPPGFIPPGGSARTSPVSLVSSRWTRITALQPAVRNGITEPGALAEGSGKSVANKILSGNMPAPHKKTTGRQRCIKASDWAGTSCRVKGVFPDGALANR